EERIDSLIHMSETEYGINRMTSLSDLSSEHLDTRATVTYLMSLYLSLLGRSHVGRLLQQSPRSSIVSST
ncbi:hypothetical protein PFISCL1PPCAC_17780, partial [Pristionchus fissidentatus]